VEFLTNRYQVSHERVVLDRRRKASRRPKRFMRLRGPGFACSLCMIRKLKSGEYRLYSRKLDPKIGKRRNLGTFASRAAAEKHERAVQFFKRAHY